MLLMSDTQKVDIENISKRSNCKRYRHIIHKKSREN